MNAQVTTPKPIGIHASGKVLLPSPKRVAPSNITKDQFVARAIYMGEFIDVRSLLQSTRATAQQPAVVPLDGGGIVVVYRYGAVIFFHSSARLEDRFLDDLRPLITHKYSEPEFEEMIVRVRPNDHEGIENGAVVVNDASNERLEIVAAVLGKSVALAQYEADIAENFEQIEPFASELERSGSGGRNMRQLLRHTGRALLNEHKMVARAEVVDRPEILWDRPELEQLYLRLEDEFELRERAAILDRKLDLISRTVSTVLDLLQKRRSSRVEWYIVALIVLEIVLSLYDLIVNRV